MSKQQGIGKPFSNMELSSFCGQIALILKSGISAYEGLTLMSEDVEAAGEKSVLDALISGMQEGDDLHQSMEKTGLFPAYLLHMVKIGEETGTLDEVMEALQRHYEREDSIRRSIRSAITYPAAMTGMMIVVILVLLVKVMPIFGQVFVQLGTEMTGFSRVLMNAGTAISRYSVVFIALLAILLVLALYLTGTSSGHAALRRLGYAVPLTRTIFEKTAACRFASGMALTLRSGINPEHGMELVCGSNEDPYFQKKLDDCQSRIEQGDDLSQALQSSGILNGMYARMASIGSKTGTMDQVMNQIADLYQDEIDTRMSNLLSVLEPTLVILLSVIVGIILLSVMLPLLGVMSGL